MSDSLDKVIDTAKKLRKFAKKVSDPAFVNLIADLNLQRADLKLQLVDEQQSGRRPAAPERHAPAPAPAAEAMPPTAAAQVGSKFDSLFGTGPREPS